MDSLCLMALQIVSEDCSEDLSQCHGEFTKKHMLKDEVVQDLIAAASNCK